MRALVSFAFLLALTTGAFGQKVCFVDMERVLEAHKGTKLALTEAATARDARIDALNQKGEEIRVMREDLDLLRAGSPEHLDQLKRIQVESAGLELDRRMAVIEYNLKLIEKVSALYKECVKAVAEVCKKKGFVGAIAYTTREIGGRSYAEYKSSIAASGVVWHDLGHDVTQDVMRAVSQ